MKAMAVGEPALIPRLSAAVLAGGTSSRMGTDKALLELDGVPLATSVASKLEALSDDVFVVAKSEIDIPSRVVLDSLDEQTPLAGVISGLRAAAHPYVFICACDMPMLSLDLIAKLADRAEDYEAVVPIHDDRMQTLHTVWSVRCLPKLEALWDRGERSVFGALQKLDVYIVKAEAETHSFTNLNTPADLEAVVSPSRSQAG